MMTIVKFHFGILMTHYLCLHMWLALG